MLHVCTVHRTELVMWRCQVKVAME